MTMLDMPILVPRRRFVRPHTIGSWDKPPAKIDSRTSFSWGDKNCEVHYVGDIKWSDGVNYNVIVSTDSKDNIGSLGRHINDIFLTNRDTKRMCLGFWDGLLNWAGEHSKYALISDGNIPGLSVNYVVPSQFSRIPQAQKSSLKEVDFLLYDNRYSQNFYQRFRELFTFQPDELDRTCLIEHANYPIFDCKLYYQVSLKREAEEKLISGSEDLK